MHLLESKLGAIQGVLKTRVGYLGGSTLNPNYENIGDHSESIEIVFDSSRVSYSNLVKAFFRCHQPNKTRLLRQYASIIFPTTSEQNIVAFEEKNRFELGQKFKCTTEIIEKDSRTFYQAENYHQKYLLRNYPSLTSLLENKLGISLDSEEFLTGELSTKLNGYFSGESQDIQTDITDILRRMNIDTESLKLLLESLDELR